MVSISNKQIVAALSVLIVFAVDAPALSEAQERSPQALDGAERPVFALSSDPFFADVQKVLTGLVRRKGHAVTNHFCVIGYAVPQGHGSAWVYWQEGNAIILWEATTDAEVRLDLSRRYLDLKKDVVPTEEDVGGSTYLVTRAWVRQVTTDCTKRGTNFVISRDGSAK